MGLPPSDDKKIQIAFESFCKKVIFTELLKHKKDVETKRTKEISMSDMPDEFGANDSYFAEHFFEVFGDAFIVKSDCIAKALKTLTQIEIEIILLTYYFVVSDVEIGKKLNMLRQTVKNKREAALKKLRAEMEKNGYGKK